MVPNMYVGFEEQFDFLSDEYIKLYEDSDATIFQAPLWLETLHKTLMPRLGAQQKTLVIREGQEGRLLAVFPFVEQKTGGLCVLQPADFGVSDYNAVVGEDWTLEELVQTPALLKKMEQLVSAYDLLLIRKVRSDVFDVRRFFRHMVMSEGENATYHCDIVPDFTTWHTTTLRTKSRKELRRLRRRFEEAHGPFRLKTVTDPAEMIKVMEFIQTARRGRFEEDLLQKEPWFHFYREFILSSAPKGEGRLFALYYEEQLLSALYGLMGKGDFHAVLTASDLHNYEHFSVGNHMFLEAMRTLGHEGVTRFDMGPGYSPYKKFFGATETRLYNYSSSRAILGTVAALTYHHAKPLKNILKKYLPDFR